MYCAQGSGGGLGSYKNLEASGHSSSFEENGLKGREDLVRGGDDRSGDRGDLGRGEEGVASESGNLVMDQERGELSYFEVLDFAHQIARGMEHLEKMKVCESSQLCFFVCTDIIMDLASH